LRSPHRGYAQTTTRLRPYPPPRSVAYRVRRRRAGIVPRLRPIEESVSQRHTLNCIGTEQPRFQFRIRPRTYCHTRARIYIKRGRLIRQRPCRCLQEESARLL
jgi:hypothetical protein